jgi:D-aminopeptidase
MVHETRTRPTKHKAKKLRESLKELKEGLSFGLLTRRKEDKTMISVSLSLQPRAAAAVLTPGVECVALKELQAL